MPRVSIENLLCARRPGFPGGHESFLLGLENDSQLTYGANSTRFTFVEGRAPVQGHLA